MLIRFRDLSRGFSISPYHAMLPSPGTKPVQWHLFSLSLRGFRIKFSPQFIAHTKPHMAAIPADKIRHVIMRLLALGHHPGWRDLAAVPEFASD